MSILKTLRELGASGRPVALVTGGSRRVGRSIAVELARSGCDVVITSREPNAESDSTIREVVIAGGSGRAIPLDLEDCHRLPEQVGALSRALPRLDVLVHNASVYEPTPHDSLNADSALITYRINALAPLLLTLGLVDPLTRSVLYGGGAVVALCDVHAIPGYGPPRREPYSAYSMSKAALAQMVRSLARELAPKIRVFGVAPGAVEWPETGPEAGEAAQRAYLDRVPLERVGTAEDAAAAVAFLALRAPYMTGHILPVDGGRNLV